VRLHGGEVEVSSAGIDRGATFVVTFNDSETPFVATDHAAVQGTVIALDGHSVMLLDDHADSRELIAEALRNAGAQVAAFGAARQAFAALERIRPSVIVADIALPDEDGYSFIRRVRTHSTPSIQSIPAIAVTAYAAAPDRAEALSVGFQQHMAKPIDLRRLLHAIHELTLRPVRS
jgi:CheY-like chemotaxis protein